MRAESRISHLYIVALQVSAVLFPGPSPPQDNPIGFKDEKGKGGRKCRNTKRCLCEHKSNPK